MLDVGCGGGILAEAMAARGAQVTGIDLADKPLTVAKLHGLESGIAVDYRADRRRGARARVAGVVRRGDLHGTARARARPGVDASPPARRSREPGGTSSFSTINRNPKSYLFAIVGAEYVLRLLPRGTHDWTRFVTPAELAAFARRAGLESAAMTGMTYNPLARTYRLAPDTSVNYLAAFRKPDADAAGVSGARLDVDAVLFDLDGTLADTAADLAGALNRVRADHGWPPSPVDALRPYASVGRARAARRRHGPHARGRRLRRRRARRSSRTTRTGSP